MLPSSSLVDAPTATSTASANDLKPGFDAKTRWSAARGSASPSIAFMAACNAGSLHCRWTSLEGSSSTRRRSSGMRHAASCSTSTVGGSARFVFVTGAARTSCFCLLI